MSLHSIPVKLTNPQVATNVVNPMLPAPSPSHHHVYGWDFNHLQTVTFWHWPALYILSLLETNKDVENSPFVDHVPCDLCFPIGFPHLFWAVYRRVSLFVRHQGEQTGRWRSASGCCLHVWCLCPSHHQHAGARLGPGLWRKWKVQLGWLSYLSTMVKTSISWDINYIKQDEARTTIVISIELFDMG